VFSYYHTTLSSSTHSSALLIEMLRPAAMMLPLYEVIWLRRIGMSLMVTLPSVELSEALMAAVMPVSQGVAPLMV
jgi:hypothetical protein